MDDNRLTPQAREAYALAVRLLESAAELAEAGADSRSLATVIDQAGRLLRDTARALRKGQ